MKKLSLLLIAVMLFCSACSNNTIQPQVNDEATPTIAPASPTPTTPGSPALSPDEARSIAQTWLDKHPDIQFTGEMPNNFETESTIMAYDGEDYYLFYLDNPEAYWFSVLVHIETGTLLYRMMPDGEFPEEEIEPLEDWYNRYYGE